MSDPTTDPCPPPAPECPFGSGCPSVQSLRDLILKEHESTRKEIGKLAARLDWVEASGETTMAETVKAKIARAEDKAQIEMLTEVARKSGSEAGKAEARLLQRAQRKLYLAAAAVLVALATAIPVLVQHYTEHPQPLAPAASR